MRKLLFVTLLCALIVSPAIADLSWQTEPILGTGGSSDTGDLVIITGPQPFKSDGTPYHAWIGGPEVLGPTIPHYSIDEPAHGGDNLYHVGSPSMTEFLMNANTWSDAYNTYYDPALQIHAGSGVNLTAGQKYSYEAVFKYLGPNDAYSVTSAKKASYEAEANLVMLHSWILDLWREDAGQWEYTETWTELASGASITSSRGFNVVPVPGAVLLGLLGLSAAGLRLRKSA